MRKGKVFLIGNERQLLIPMSETEYVREEILQEYLAQFPDLLPGEQIDPEDPPRWLFVGREIGVPGDTDEAARWSLDHLFLDHNAVPTFVECKRSSDTRGRREVVAQMLDYAANGIEYWSIPTLRAQVADDKVRALLNSSEEDTPVIDEFWQNVEKNLRAGIVRLIFVADETPKELRRLVEFLNRQMVDVQVLAVELKQYLSDDHKVLVPRVIGVTEAARDMKSKGGSRRKTTTREEFLSQLADPIAVNFFTHVLDLAVRQGHTISWGEKGFSMRVHLKASDRLASFAYGWPGGTFQFYFAELPLSEAEATKLRKELMDFGVFEKSGNKTLKAIVNSNTVEPLQRAVDFILQQVDRISDL